MECAAIIPGASSSSEDLLRRSIAAAVECSYKRSTSQDKLCDGEFSHYTWGHTCYGTVVYNVSF